MNDKTRKRRECRPAPAFQLYASDLLAPWQFVNAGLKERGLLLTMEARYWVDGSLPSDHRNLAKRLGIDYEDVHENYGELIHKYFAVDPTDASRLINDLLDLQKRQHEERTTRMSHGGRKGGRATQEKIREAVRNESQASRHPSRVAKAPETSGDETSGGEKSFASESDDDEDLEVHREWLDQHGR